MNFIELEAKRAIISECGRYRYALYRDLRTHPKYVGRGPHDDGKRWEPRPCMFIMLNPSTADGTLDDPTIRRCLGFAHRLQCDQLFVGNLFAWRATDPRDLRKNGVGGGDIVGPLNLEWLKAMADVTWRREANRGIVIAAWGPGGYYMQQDQAVLSWLESEIIHEGEQVHCLGRSVGGWPRHPLMLRKTAEFEVFK